MGKTTGRVLALSAILVLGACAPQPYLPPQYAVPEPPPLQPYMGPTVAYAAPTVTTRRPIVRRHYVRRRHHRRVRCRCLPVR